MIKLQVIGGGTGEASFVVGHLAPAKHSQYCCSAGVRYSRTGTSPVF